MTTTELETEDSSSQLFIVRRQLSGLVEVEVEAAGKWLHTYEKLRISKSNIESNCAEDSSSEEENGSPELEVVDDIKYLRTLSSKDWKDQDHYMVLGIAKYRYRAKDADIKKAYHTMVLRHHPDKKGGQTKGKNDDEYFTCIKMAYEVLGVPAKRRAYDSIDPDFNDDIPAVNAKTKKKFFEEYAPVFERNARWSVRKHAPLLGNEDDPRSKVELFYGFWYDFDTWREFSYLDEEDKEKGADRDERRWIEKQNKVERSKRRKEEIVRIRKLVDNAYNSDPRIVKFKEEDKEKRLAIRKAKQDAIRKRQEEYDRIKREQFEKELSIKREEEERIKIKLTNEKKEREAVKKLCRNTKKIFRNLCQDNNYFSNNENDRIKSMTDVELLCEALNVLKLQDLNQQISQADAVGKKAAFMTHVAEVREQIEREKMGSTYQPKCFTTPTACIRPKEWSNQELQTLIKAVNLFPAGTAKRWEVVAEYLKQHCANSTVRTSKDVLTKAKDLQNSDGERREATNKNAFQELIKNQNVKSMIDDSHASERLETPQEVSIVTITKWVPEEQKLLEQAMKTYPSSTPSRWDKVAECLPNKNKKECMVRYKELVERVKAKKAATIAVASSK